MSCEGDSHKIKGNGKQLCPKCVCDDKQNRTIDKHAMTNQVKNTDSWNISLFPKRKVLNGNMNVITLSGLFKVKNETLLFSKLFS